MIRSKHKKEPEGEEPVQKLMTETTIKPHHTSRVWYLQTR